MGGTDFEAPGGRVREVGKRAANPAAVTRETVYRAEVATAGESGGLLFREGIETLGPDGAVRERRWTVTSVGVSGG